MKGLKAVNSLVISGGAFTIDAADDAVHTNAGMTVSGGTFAIATGDDAFHADETLTVTGGAIDISESYEGLEALHPDIQGGEIFLVSRDDGLNAAGGADGSGSTGGRDGRFGGGWMGGAPEAPAGPGEAPERPDGSAKEPVEPPQDAADGSVAPPEMPEGGGRGGRGGMGGGFSSASSEGSIAISGGTLTIQASGDGLDANGTIEITGGTTVVTGPTSGDTAVLDYDTSATIAGGTFLGTGAAGMAQTFRSAEQGVVAERVSGSAGDEIVLADASGTALPTPSPALDFQFIVLSSPDLVSGETYTLNRRHFDRGAGGLTPQKRGAPLPQTRGGGVPFFALRPMAYFFSAQFWLSAWSAAMCA